jgi:hypothetical protein
MSALNIQNIQSQVHEPNLMNSLASWFISMEDQGLVTKVASYAIWFFVQVALCVPLVTIPLYTRLVEEYTILRNNAAIESYFNNQQYSINAPYENIQSQNFCGSETYADLDHLKTEVQSLRESLTAATEEKAQLSLKSERQNLEIERLQMTVGALQRQNGQIPRELSAARNANKGDDDQLAEYLDIKTREIEERFRIKEESLKLDFEKSQKELENRFKDLEFELFTAKEYAKEDSRHYEMLKKAAVKLKEENKQLKSELESLKKATTDDPHFSVVV